MDTLTALRFAAALLVFGTHAELILDLPAPPLEIGYVGVSFFFVLSGFVLTWSRREGETRRRFYWHRFARVWPSTTLVTLLLVGLGARQASLLSDLLLLHGWRAGGLAGVAPNPPSWSLGTEAFFYALFPLLVAWACARRRMALTGLCVIMTVTVATFLLAPVLGDELRTYRFPPLRAGEFALGVIAAEAMRRGWRPRLGMTVATLAVVLTYSVGTGLWLTYGAQMWVVNALVGPTFVLLVIAGASRDLGGASTPAWMTALGRWSFAFYLLHWPVLAVVGISVSGLDAAAVAFAITLTLSAALFAWFERPVERWLRHTTLKRSRTPASAPV